MANKSGYIGRNPGDGNSAIVRQTYSLTSETTELSFTAGYIVGFVDVYLNGVKLIDPETVFLNFDTNISKDVTIHPNVVFGKNVKISSAVEIKSFSHIEDCEIHENCVIGPFARIRGESILGKETKIGNFVEIKKSNLDKNVKVNHLSYIGDSEIGISTNIGAGTVTCNYDGHKKSKTVIKDNAFIGSNSSLVAPVTIEQDSIVGAGSVITKNVKKKMLKNALTIREPLTWCPQKNPA